MTEEQDGIDALSLLEVDAFERSRDAEGTAKAFRALESLIAAFGEACEGKFNLDHARSLVEQTKRLAQMMEDFYAARGQ